MFRCRRSGCITVRFSPCSMGTKEDHSLPRSLRNQDHLVQRYIVPRSADWNPADRNRYTNKARLKAYGVQASARTRAPIKPEKHPLAKDSNLRDFVPAGSEQPTESSLDLRDPAPDRNVKQSRSTVGSVLVIRGSDTLFGKCLAPAGSLLHDGEALSLHGGQGHLHLPASAKFLGHRRVRAASS